MAISQSTRDYYKTFYNLENEHDLELIESAQKMSWYEIDECQAHTEEGRSALHCIMMRGYHADEFSCGML